MQLAACQDDAAALVRDCRRKRHERVAGQGGAHDARGVTDERKGTMMTKAGLMLIQSAVMRAVCTERTERDLRALQESFEQVCELPADVAWERKAAAHTEFHNLLADATGNPVFAILVRSMTGTLHDIMVMAGPAAEDIIIGSRSRLLRHLGARDEENAAAEMEDLLARLDDMRGQAATARRPRSQLVNSAILARQLSDPPRVISAGCSSPHRAR